MPGSYKLVLRSHVSFSMVLNEKTKKITYHPQKIENTFPRPTHLALSMMDLTSEQVSIDDTVL
jgi:hypothetical protein